MNNATRHPWWLTIIAVASVALAGCSTDSAGTKAGGDAAPVTLRIGTADDSGRPAAAAIEEFARQAKSLSGGRLIIEPVWKAEGEGVDDWDQAVARMVKDGRLDLGMIPARAWDTEGVTSLSALHAPFLVTSDALADQIVTTDLAGEMMAGLTEAGVTGLALLPESLRHPFGFGHALVAPSDYAGKGIRTAHSDLGDAVLRALGAKPENTSGDAYRMAITAGSIVGADTSFVWADTLPAPAIASGNVTLYTKVNSLVINSKTLSKLAPAQRTALQNAAAATLRWQLGHRTTEAEAAKVFCSQGGGTVVSANAADLRALTHAVQPVYDQLERDPNTKNLIDRIRALKRTVQVPAQGVATPCRSSAASSTPPPAAAGDQGVLNDTYRIEITQADLRGFGVTKPNDLAINEGVWTWTLQNGHYSFDQKAPQETDHQEGKYTVAGNRVTFYLSWVDNLPLTFTWQIVDRTLTFHLVGDTDPILEATFTAHPWTKIG